MDYTVDQLNEDRNTIEQLLKQRKAAERLDALLVRISDYHASIQGLEKQKADLTRDVSELSTELDELEGRHEQRVDELEADYNTRKAGLDKDIDESLQLFAKGSQRMESELAELKQRVDAEKSLLTGEIHGLKSEKEQLENAVGKLNAELDALRERVSKI